MYKKTLQRVSRTRKMFGCKNHNYILIKQDTTRNIYKCSKCGDKLKLNKDNICCVCINTCKNKVQSVIDKKRKIYKKCNNYNKGVK